MGYVVGIYNYLYDTIEIKEEAFYSIREAEFSLYNEIQDFIDKRYSYNENLTKFVDKILDINKKIYNHGEFPITNNKFLVFSRTTNIIDIYEKEINSNLLYNTEKIIKILKLFVKPIDLKFCY